MATSATRRRTTRAPGARPPRAAWRRGSSRPARTCGARGPAWPADRPLPGPRSGAGPAAPEPSSPGDLVRRVAPAVAARVLGVPLAALAGDLLELDGVDAVYEVLPGCRCWLAGDVQTARKPPAVHRETSLGRPARHLRSSAGSGLD